MPRSDQKSYGPTHLRRPGGSFRQPDDPSPSHEFQHRQDLHWWPISSSDKRDRTGESLWGDASLTATSRSRAGTYVVTHRTPGILKACGISRGRSTATGLFGHAVIETSGDHVIYVWGSPTAEYGTTIGGGPYATSMAWDTSERPRRGQRSGTRGYAAKAATNSSASADGQNPLDVSREKYAVSVEIAQFVLRGIHAAEEFARRQLSADRGWLELDHQVPTEGLTVGTLVPMVTHRLARMFRSLASEARENGLALRPLTEGASWSLDLQFNVLERLPVRPDETSEFLRALLRDILHSAGEGRIISGRWGEVQFRSSSNNPELVV
jgi:hypothetical protein